MNKFWTGGSQKGGAETMRRLPMFAVKFTAVLAIVFALLAAGSFAQAPKAFAEDEPSGDVYFTVKHVTDNGGTTEEKTYTKEQFEELVSDSSDPVSAQYGKGTWNVLTATKYVTLEDLFNDAGFGDLYKSGSGATVTYSMSDDDPSKVQTYDVSFLVNESKFFPNVGAEKDTSGAVDVPAVLALESASTPVTDGTSVEAETENLKNTVASELPRMVFGASEDQIVNNGAFGNRLWSNLKEITITDPTFTLTKADGTLIKGYSDNELRSLKSESGDPVSGQFYKTGWRVWTATEYVTLEDLFNDAGIGDLYKDGSAATITYEGKNGVPNVHSIYKLLHDSKFFPNAGPGNLTDASGAYDVPAVLALNGAQSTVATTSSEAETANVENAGTGSMPVMIFGTTDEAFAANTSSGMQFWTGLTNIAVNDDPYFTVNRQDENGKVTVAKKYSKEEFDSLKSDSTDPVSGQYYKSGWNVWTATKYVTLEDLFADAGVADLYADGKGSTITYQGKNEGNIQTHEVSRLLNDSKFFPNVAVDDETNVSDPVDVPAVIAIEGARTAPIATNSADAQTDNAANPSTNSMPVMVFGTTAELVASKESSGMQFWTGLNYVTISAKQKPAEEPKPEPTPAPKPATLAKQTVSTSKAAYTIVNGKTASLGAKAKTAVSYKSSNTKVAAVSAAGKITAKGVGTAKITVSAKASSKYASASKTVTVKVNPKAVKLSKAKAAKKSFKATWKKASKANADGYQVRYAIAKSMKAAKSVKVKGYKATSKTVKKLKAKKKYYVQVRTYKKVSGKTYYSAWSAKKSVKTKK